MNKDQLMIRQIDVKPSDEDMVIEGYAAVYDFFVLCPVIIGP